MSEEMSEEMSLLDLAETGDSDFFRNYTSNNNFGHTASVFNDKTENAGNAHKVFTHNKNKKEEQKAIKMWNYATPEERMDAIKYTTSHHVGKYNNRGLNLKNTSLDTIHEF